MHIHVIYVTVIVKEHKVINLIVGRTWMELEEGDWWGAEKSEERDIMIL